MFCHYCGKEIKDTAQFCPHCGQKVQKESSNKKRTLNRVMQFLAIIIIVLFCLLGLFLLFSRLNKESEQTNERVEGLLTLNGEFYSGEIINDEDAITAAQSCQEKLGLTNAMDNLSAFHVTQTGDERYYRLQQNYKGIPVYKRFVVVVASEAGEPLAISTDVHDIPDNFSLTATVTKEQIYNSIRSYAIKNWGVFDEEMAIPELSDEMLVIYDQFDSVILAYQLNIFCENDYEIIVDANNGSIIDCVNATRSVDTEGTVEGSDIRFPVRYRADKNEYVIQDSSKSIFLYNLKKNSSHKEGFWDKKEEVVSSGDSIFGNTKEEKKQQPQKAGSLISLIGQIADYYNDNFGQELPFGVVVAFYNDSSDFGFNAFGGYTDFTTNDGESVRWGTMYVGHKLSCDEKDVIAHEYTHIVAAEHEAARGNGKESGSIAEGLADTFACFYTSDWDIDLTPVKGSHRNAIDPSKYDYPSKITDWNKSGEDYSHGYATVISHAAYLMKNSAKFQNNELEQLWYKTLIRLPYNCTYLNLRYCMEQAAAVSKYSEAQKQAVKDAFDEVGIVDSRETKYGNDISISAFDKSESAYDDYTITIDGETSGGLFGVGSESVHRVIEVENTDVQDVHLEKGTYSILLTDHASDNRVEYQIKVKGDKEEDSEKKYGKNICAYDFGAEYTVAPNAKLTILDHDGNELLDCSASVDGVENGIENGIIKLKEKNYYTVILSNKQGRITYYDLFTLRVKAGTADHIAFKTRFSSNEPIPNGVVQGEYSIDVEQTNNENGMSVREYFGSGINYGNNLTLNIDGTASWYIGIGNGGEGKYTFSGTDGKLTYNEYKGGNESILDISYNDDEEYILMDYNSYLIYWTKNSDDESSKRETISEEPTTGDKKQFLDELPILESDQYNENEGDSFVYKIGSHRFTRGNIDISGKSYEHGIEAWIARWNYQAESSWAYSIFSLDRKYKTLNGECVLIKSYNTTNFDVTLEFIGDGKKLKSYTLKPDSLPSNIEVDVSGVEKLMVYVRDNISVKGGTSFGLVEMCLDQANPTDKSEERSDEGTTLAKDTESDKTNRYEVFENSSVTTWEEAQEYCMSLGGHLAIINSAEENERVFNLMIESGYSSAYFGITDSIEEGNWIWVNGQSAEYTNWHEGEPNSENPGEDFGMFYWKYTDGTWNDGDFGGSTVSGGAAFICEWEA